jgi:hypothetical protein
MENDGIKFKNHPYFMLRVCIIHVSICAMVILILLITTICKLFSHILLILTLFDIRTYGGVAMGYSSFF